MIWLLAPPRYITWQKGLEILYIICISYFILWAGGIESVLRQCFVKQTLEGLWCCYRTYCTVYMQKIFFHSNTQKESTKEIVLTTIRFLNSSGFGKTAHLSMVKSSPTQEITGSVNQLSLLSTCGRGCRFCSTFPKELEHILLSLLETQITWKTKEQWLMILFSVSRSLFL